MMMVFRNNCAHPSPSRWRLVQAGAAIMPLAYSGLLYAQLTTLARTVLEGNGVGDAQIVEVPIGQRVAVIITGQVGAAYTLPEFILTKARSLPIFQREVQR